ncbi:MAG: HD domain-containing protein [Lachnospiraceae bacterium]|nr:HD domain-containing protein [Agathobacter sp.]MDD6290359.1 HD domain-containing protein [Lachnospiraceae bacterium]
MAVHTFAAIYIGTYDVSLKVFEFTNRKKVHEVDHIRSRQDLGRDAFSKGKIGYEQVEELCETLAQFKQIMQGYKVDNYEVYAAAVLRDASNELSVLDQIYLRTGFRVKVVSNSEHRFISYKSVAGQEMFEKMIQTSAAVIDVGGASVQITVFRNGKLTTTQHIEAGIMRIRNLLGDRGHALKLYETQIEEYMNKKLEGFRAMYMAESVDHVILISDYATELIRRIDNKETVCQVKSERFVKYIEKLESKTLEEITAELNLSDDREPLIIPAIVLFKTLVLNVSPKEVWVPGANILDGIAYDYAQRNKLLSITHDFDADVLSAAQYLSQHYNSYSPHIEALSKLSIKIFDAMKKVHGLGKRQRLLLEVATILHDCGKFVSLSESPESAYHIIMSSEIIGLTHKEREIVALVVLYNTLPLDPYEELSDCLDEGEYLCVAKLSAILRVANALDQSHKQKFKNIRIAVRERRLVFTVEAFEDISLEQALFEAKTAYFENVYSMKPVLKEKRIYNY